MKTYSRQYRGNQWDDAGVVTRRFRFDGKPRAVLEFDDAPLNERSRVARIDLSVDDLILLATGLMQGHQNLLAHITKKVVEDRNHETMRADEAEKREAALQAALAKAEEKLKETQKLRAIGGAI